jgi:zinc protease
MRVDNSPQGIAFEKLFGAVHGGTQYEWPPIGSMDDISSITIDHAEKFYRTYYAPNNAVLVIVGNLDIEKTQELVKKYFGSIPSSKIPEFNWQAPKGRLKAQTITLRRKVESPILMMTFRSGPETGKLQPTADLVSDVLAQGTSSRLYRKMVYEAKIAVGVQASAYGEQHSGSFLVIANLRDKKFLPQAKKMIADELKNLQLKAVSENELAKVKVQIEKEYIDLLKTYMGRSRYLAHFEVMYGDYRKLFSRAEEYQKVTTKSIRDFALQTFKPNQMIVTEVVGE